MVVREQLRYQVEITLRGYYGGVAQWIVFGLNAVSAVASQQVTITRIIRKVAIAMAARKLGQEAPVPRLTVSYQG